MTAAENYSCLPSSEDASKALKKVCQDNEEWRDIVTQSIQYATNSSAMINISSTSTSDETMTDINKDVGDKRVKETVLYLLQNINSACPSSVDVKMGEEDATQKSADGPTNTRDTAENVLVDALWLSGTMLEPLTRPGTTPQSTDKDAGDDKTVDAYAALCKLTSDLTKTPETDDGTNICPIPRRKLLTSLEPKHLKASGILSEQFLQLFIKKIRKLNTDMYYRQKKVNLMQEESEGYAKFLRFLVNLPQVKEMDGDNDAPATECGNITSRNSRDDTVQLAKFRITELIGTFDLDPNRCLDLTLDALEGEIRETISSQPKKGQTPNYYQSIRNSPGSAMTVHVLIQIIKLFPVENVTHLIGFKYVSYAKDGEKETPKSLFLTTVILVSHKLLSLSSLKPHLPPLSEIHGSFLNWKQNYQKKIKKMGVVSLNSSKKKSDTSDETKSNDFDGNKLQIIQLFQILLEMGIEWRLAVEVFGHSRNGSKNSNNEDIVDIISKCCCLSSSLGLSLCDILHSAVMPIYDGKVVDIGQSLCLSKKEEGEVPSANGDYTLLPVDMNNTKVMELNSCCTLVEMLKAIKCFLEPIMMSGCMATNAILYTKLCRLTSAMLLESNQNKKEITEIDDQVLEFLETFLVPSLSLFPFNPAIASELWSVLSLLSYQLRYALYASWRKHGLEKAALRSMVQPPKPLAHIESEVNTGISTKYLLKRMSKENIKDMGRQVSKVAHNNPLVVFTLMLNQIESYDNLILMMVDTFKFMGILSLDVMGYCLLVSLGGEGEGRSKLKDDGVNAAQWLSSLETFTGAFFKKFTDVELNGLLMYFMRRLHDGHILELGVLQSLLKRTGGYGFVDSGSAASLSMVQLDGRCGSLVLRKETSDFGIVELVNIDSSRRLRTSLHHHDCGVKFLILLSQLRANLIYDESRERPKQIKLIGNLYDNCQRTLNTLLPFLTDGSQDTKDNLSGEDIGTISMYAKVLPNIGELNTKFGVATADSWALCRPLIRASLFAEEALSDKKSNTIPAHLQAFHPTSGGMTSSYHGMLPPASWNHITPLLFHRFYSFAIYDLTCPEKRYQSEITRIKREIDRLKLLQKGGRDAIGIQASMASAVAAAGGTERDIRQATAFTIEHSIELDRFTRTSEMLSIDMKRQKKHSDHVKHILKSEKDQFFSALDGENGSLNSASVFFTTCLYPRIGLSPEDAMYCSRFIALLHSYNTPGFSTMKLLDVLMSAVVGGLYSITEDEAGCLGIFLNEQWKIISEWRYDEKSYETNVYGKHGGKLENDSKSMTHLDFIEVYNRWHASLGVAFIGCLKSSEYMHTRTALIILSRIVDDFPTKSTLGEKLLDALVPLQEDSNPMQDIKAMAQGYSSKIIIARDTGKWKEEDSRITRAREEKEKKMQLNRQKNVKKQFEEMEKDMANSAKQSTDRQERNPRERRAQPRFTPVQKSTVEKTTHSHGDRNGRGPNVRKEENGARRTEPRNGERWERTGPQEPSKGTKRGRSPESARGGNERSRPSDRDRGRRGDTPPRRATRQRNRR